MKIIKPSHKHMTHNGLTPQQFIEIIGRTCYKSTEKITDESNERFVNNLIERNHWAMLEHETIYIETSQAIAQSFAEEIYELNIDPAFFHISYIGVTRGVISGSIRSFADLFNIIDITYGHLYAFWIILKQKYSWIFNKLYNEDLNDDFIPKVQSTVEKYTRILDRDDFIAMYLEPQKFGMHKLNDNTILFRHLTHTVKFICDRGVSHELVRHRPVSFAQESTRYCDYRKDKHGNEITVIEPIFYSENSDCPYAKKAYDIWKTSCECAEKAYFELLAMKSTPQEARDVLPNSLKTEIIMTATEEEWQHIVNLRAKGTTGQPHPQMVEIMQPWYEELKEITNRRIK